MKPCMLPQEEHASALLTWCSLKARSDVNHIILMRVTACCRSSGPRGRRRVDLRVAR